MAGINLYADELITCENGHPFGRVRFSCESGKDDWMNAIDWLQYVPSEGGSTRCRACNARWFFVLAVADDPSNKRGRIHVDDQWRPPLDDLDRHHMKIQDTTANA